MKKLLLTLLLLCPTLSIAGNSAFTGGGGTGTVTLVSVVSANGVSGSVASPSTTPAITLTLGAITPSTVNGLTLAAQTNGFTIAGGTTSKTLTVPLDATVSGTNTGDQTTVTGNAGTATALQTARDIGGTSFNGTASIVPQTIQVVDSTDTSSWIAMFDSATGNMQPKTDTGITYNASTGNLNASSFSGPLTGNATTATVLATARTISITGDLAYTSPSFDGSGNVTAAGTLTTVNSNVGSFTCMNATVNAKGLITAAANGSCGGGGSPGGSSTQVQFNDSSSFGGNANFTFDKTDSSFNLGDGGSTTPTLLLGGTGSNIAALATFPNVTTTNAASILLDASSTYASAIISANVIQLATATTPLIFQITDIGGVKTYTLSIAGIPTFANDAGATGGGLTSGMLYKTTTSGSTFLKIVP